MNKVYFTQEQKQRIFNLVKPIFSETMLDGDTGNPDEYEEDFWRRFESAMTTIGIDGVSVEKWGEAIDIIQWLVDLQNGCPLEKYRVDWERETKRAYAFLSDNKEFKP